jgi:MbtH-like protein
MACHYSVKIATHNCRLLMQHSYIQQGKAAIQMNTEDSAIYSVVVNHEEQYSLWPMGKHVSGCLKARKDGGRTRF